MRGMLSTEALARGSAKRPKRVIAAWAALLVVAMGLLGALFSDALTTEFSPTKEPESKRAEQLLIELRGQETVPETVLLRSETLTVDDEAFRSRVGELREELTALGPDVVAGVVDFVATGDESLVSADRHATVLLVAMTGSVRDAEKNVEGVHEAVDRAGEAPGFEAFVTGETTFAVDFAEQAQADTERGEAFGVPIALVILAVVFGAIGAAVLPMVLAMIAIVISLAVATLVGQVYDLHVFTQNVATMIGLAVGIDYSLFIVSRFREERRKGLEVQDAIGAAGATASRAVFFSGAVVVIALLGMLIIPFTAFFSVGLGAVLVVLAAVAASLTLLPALLSLMGDRVNRLRVPLVGRREGAPGADEGGWWDRVSHGVMGHPWLSLALGGGLLLAMTAPLLTIDTGLSGASTFPEDLRARQGFEALQEDFGFGADAPVQIVVEGDVDSPAAVAAIDELRGLLAADARFGPSTLETAASGDLAVIVAPAVGDPQSREATEAIGTIRDDYVPQAFAATNIGVFVGGQSAETVDFVELTRRFLPIVLSLILALSLIMLTLVFRSIVVPVKAILLNLLSVGASYGMLVLVFQHGVGADLLGFQESPIIQAWIPLFLFAILFGLSMDYHVFLLSRIREAYDNGASNDDAVAFGVRSTAGLITGAALIMVAVFSGFAAGELVPFQQMGFGLAVAVFLDATIVRVVLVPASMKLLGDRNWYLPSFLDWLPDLRVEGVPTRPEPALVPVRVEVER